MDPFQSMEVVNRRKITYETQFDGRVIVFKPFEKRHYPQNVAISIVSGSNLRINAGSGIPKDYALGITGHKAFPTDPLEGEIASENPIEMLDRSDDYQLTQTEPTILSEDGEQKMGIGKAKRRTTPVPKDVQPVQFHNEKVKLGPQNAGEYEGRINTKDG